MSEWTKKSRGRINKGTFFGRDIQEILSEFHQRQTRESLIVRDADQIALILQLKECGDLGNKYSEEWIGFALQRLVTPNGKKLAETIVQTDSTQWWFKEKDSWWVNGDKQ